MLPILVVYSVKLLVAGEQIRVAICNMARVNQSGLSMAKAEAALVYRDVGVTVVWGGCDAFRGSWFPARVPTFLVRLWNRQPPPPAGAASLDAMGEAFVERPGDGSNTADAYLPAIQASAEIHHTDLGVLLGFVLAHELGHLLLGPGHTAEGLMRAVWGQKEIDALRQRRLGFTSEYGERIRLAVDARSRE